MNEQGGLFIEASRKQEMGPKLAFLTLGAILLAVFAFAILSGYFVTVDLSRAIFALGTLGFGTAFILATVYGGLLRQQLLLNDRAATYTHGPWEKTIPWSELKMVRVLSVMNPDSKAYAIVFRSKRTEFDLAPEFDK